MVYMRRVSPVGLGKKEKIKFYPFIIYKGSIHRGYSCQVRKKGKDKVLSIYNI